MSWFSEFFIYEDEFYSIYQRMCNDGIAFWEFPIIHTYKNKIYKNPFIPLPDKPPTGLE